MMLEVKDLNVYYGAIHALRGINFHLEKGEIVTLIGANGAGKSTTLNTISGLLRARSGQILFQGEDITYTEAQDIVRKGIIQVPEGRKIFATLSVIENLEMGAYLQTDQAQIQSDLEAVLKRFPRLRERRKQFGGTLSGGEQQMLAIARGLMSRPSLLLLDEPSMGLSPILVEQIFEIIRDINEQGTSILLVEQNAQMALSIADRGYVLETGRVVLEGPAQELLHNPMVIEAYLGGHG
ncbi:MAG TPA: ABC transporter ATP-binding protein [Anaerolinea thermolimosa]|uniref:ABC transporter ATP-binding protein n=1 Tax=Anaerolinea thermolimosa TaxID=229919 RepID=A0A3D1JDA3_9CHLR|nr:ABC transporter ATP-binding protein [Anaerolinea thermolimosa]GAP07206.1 amino acid/amide ABC transporter ATP-binding protein 2, HAAT family [Anaerolinea thermolimosa]HCE16561.1 ABC transporter ATP-binding protein [Anaerolinea thermolimosa]